MDEVKFEAQIGKWVCIKKGTIEENASKIEASGLLAGIHDSMDRKIFEYLSDEINTKQLDTIAGEITQATLNKKGEYELKGRVSEQQIGEALAKINSPSTTKKMTLPENKHAMELAKTYLTRKVLEILKVRMEIDPKLIEKYLEEKKKNQ